MPRKPRTRIRTSAVLEGRRLARTIAAKLGRGVAEARARRRWTQKQLGDKVGLSESRIGQIERGLGFALPAHSWFALSVALELPLRIDFARDSLQEPTDAGHLDMQELMLRMAKQLGIARFFELPTKPTDPAFSVDVGWRDDHRHVLILNECWNSFGSINAAVRSTHRKVADAMRLAATLGGETGPFAVAACWIVRDTRRNRELLARYPEVFEAAFPGSSATWVRALTDANADIPHEPGLVWSDLHAGRLFPWRRRPAMLRAA
jgi:transcriptional regulator with XRE-family HTH domain